MRPGRPWPLGASPAVEDGLSGVNLAVWAPRAARVELCLFDAPDGMETARLALPACTDGIWHGFAPGLSPGQCYGLRAQGLGPYFQPERLLIDPWARSLCGPVDALALECGAPDGDNAARMPKARVLDWARERAAGKALAPGPRVPMARTVLYEAQVKSLTALHPGVEARQRGCFAGLASPAMLAHFRRLGITTLCLLPVQRCVTERHLLEKGLRNHWGYNTLAYFVPDARLAMDGPAPADDAGVRDEFRAMVDALHRAGLEVVLDVVYNHTAESDAQGPVLSWRGLDEANYYAHDGSGALGNPSGCGNTLNLPHPAAVQLVMDSLRWWVQAFGVDGFRFDLATSLGRDHASPGGTFSPRAALLAAIAQDPLLAGRKLIAEPWDIGDGGYRLGEFGARWHEWNDRYRDTVRAWWLGHGCTPGRFAQALTGSSAVFQPGGRTALAGINMVTAHDGFTLADLTAYERKHNLANGEGGADGHNHNLSANGGAEGPSTDPEVNARRARWRRALLGTLFLSQGVPQLLAGDEALHSQQGNNNAYCQDNAITWIDWAAADPGFTDFCAALAQLRGAWPSLRHPSWFTGQAAPGQAWPDVEWRTFDGQAPGPAYWDDPGARSLVCVITLPSEGGHAPHRRMLMAFNAHAHDAPLALPDGDWFEHLASAPGRTAASTQATRGSVAVGAQGLSLYTQPLTHP